MPNSEAVNSREYELSKGRCVTFRNNCGMLIDTRGVPVYYGVAGPKQGRKSLGGSDFIGWESVTVTADMVGSKVAVFTAHEIKADVCKESNATIAAQELFIANVLAAGGRAGFVRRPIDVALISQGRGCTVLANYPLSHLKL